VTMPLASELVTRMDSVPTIDQDGVRRVKAAVAMNLYEKVRLNVKPDLDHGPALIHNVQPADEGLGLNLFLHGRK
jgi:hypothetical protein